MQKEFVVHYKSGRIFAGFISDWNEPLRASLIHLLTERAKQNQYIGFNHSEGILFLNMNEVESFEIKL